MLFAPITHELATHEAVEIKRALLEHLAPVTDPENTARALILAYRLIDEKTVGAPKTEPQP